MWVWEWRGIDTDSPAIVAKKVPRDSNVMEGGPGLTPPSSSQLQFPELGTYDMILMIPMIPIS